MLLVSLASLGMVAVEVGLRVFHPQIFPMLPPGLVTERPDGIRVLTPGFDGPFTRAEFDTSVQISDFGVRGQPPSPRRANTFRILALGNADTFGFGVNADETYAAQLQDKLSERHPALRVEVVNAGVPGYGTIDELIWLQERGHDVDPDLILVQFLSYSDFATNGDSPLTAKLLDDAVGATVTPAPEPVTGVQPSLPSRVRGAIHALKRHSHLATLASEAGSHILMQLGLPVEASALWGEEFTAVEAERTRRLLVLLASESIGMGTPIVLIYATGKAQVIGRNGLTLPSAQVVAAAAAEAGVPWIDMTEELRHRSDRRRLFFWRDGHWTADGHQAVADVLANQLSALDLIP